MPEAYAGGGARERVLVVAPDEDAGSMLAFLLRAEGFPVYGLTDAQCALRLLRLCRGPVTVVMDSSVPDDERGQWFQLFNAVAQVRGVVVRQRSGALRTTAIEGQLNTLPCVAVGDPLQITTLMAAISAVSERARRGQLHAVRDRAPTDQVDRGSVAAGPSFPS